MTFKWPKPFTEMSFEEKMRHVDKVVIEDPLIEEVEEKLGAPRTPEELIQAALETLKEEVAKAEKKMEGTPRYERRVDEIFEAERLALGRRGR